MENPVKRILVVDDEQDIVTVLKTRLELSGYQVLTAQDGQEGLQKARSDKPDLIILDLMLPKLDGYRVCGMLKFDKSTRHIPIILFTARSSEKDRKLGEEAGADAYINKPFDPKNFLEKIKELLIVSAQTG